MSLQLLANEGLAYRLCSDLSRYSDKYRPSQAMQPTLSRKDLHQPFFPQEIFEDYFNPKRKKKSEKFILLADINILLHGGNF